MANSRLLSEVTRRAAEDVWAEFKASVTLQGNFGTVYTLSSEPLASGGYGSVYKATDDEGETVAVKYYDNSVEFRDVLREFALQNYLTRRDVPQVCRYLDGPIQTPQGAYVVIEFIAGRTLHHLIAATREQKWSEENALAMSNTFLSLMRQLSGIVARLHSECLVHYDLKPLNIMVREDSFELVLMDLGLGCFQQDCQPATQFESNPPDRDFECFQRASTFGYIPPEINRGQVVVPGDYDFRKIDVYALGKLISDLATGTMAYEKSIEYDRALHNRSVEDALGDFETHNHELNLLLHDTLLLPASERPSIQEVVTRLQELRIFNPFPIFHIK